MQATTAHQPGAFSVLKAVAKDDREPQAYVGLEFRESAIAFGGAWAKQYFGARAENALITGRVVGVSSDGLSLLADWDFPDEEAPQRLTIGLQRVGAYLAFIPNQ